VEPLLPRVCSSFSAQNLIPTHFLPRKYFFPSDATCLYFDKKGEWQTAEASSRKEDKYLLVLNFVTKASRDFRNIELYEIELFEQK
jgi:hypothetical protein